MKKRGPIIAISGIVIILISLSVFATISPSNVASPDGLPMSNPVEETFNEISNEIEIMPEDTAFFSYSALSFDAPLIWGIEIIDFESGDELSVNISNISGDEIRRLVQDERTLFELLEITQSDTTLNFEMTNLGSEPITVVLMFSEDTFSENSPALTDPSSPVVNVLLPLAISGFLLILGIVVSVIGALVTLVDLKRK